MSAYAEYLHAKTDAEREEAMIGIRFESERDNDYFNDVYEHEDDYDYDDEGEE